ncbi:MAG: ABC transporter, partial [Acidaminococcaceae bacterium]|nr:ABC transporter [Acidaminococcaceae bacterium]
MPALTHVEANQEGYRWVAITAMLFAIGIILHTVSPNVGGVTPNWTIAMYAIVINLTRPPLTRAIGIGFIAGLTLVPSSKSAFPLGNIA